MKHEEDNLQSVCVRWFGLQYPAYAMMLAHIPNGGARNPVEGAKFKRMGVRAGMPDLVLFVPASGAHGLAVELKARGGRLSAAQKSYAEAFPRFGWRHAVCRSLEEFVEVVTKYMNG